MRIDGWKARRKSAKAARARNRATGRALNSASTVEIARLAQQLSNQAHARPKETVSSKDVLESTANSPDALTLPLGREFAAFVEMTFMPDPLHEHEIVASARPDGDAGAAVAVVAEAMRRAIARADEQAASEVLSAGLTTLLRWPQSH